MQANKLTTACVVLTLAACAATNSGAPAIEQRRAGKGPGVVVFQSGLGDGLAVWQAVQSATDAMATTLSYSRPGYGRSTAADGERSPCRAAEEEHALLASAGLVPPYIVVGHSLGGLYHYAFAKLYPHDVAGLVLLDPTHPDHWVTVQRDAPAVAAVVRLARAGFSATMRREFDDQAVCVDRLRALPMPRVPVRLLVRGEFRGLEAGSFEAVARQLEADRARLLGVAAAQRVEGAGHYLQRDRPQAVSAAIAEVVDASLHR